MGSQNPGSSLVTGTGKPEGTCAYVWAGVHVSLVPVGGPVTLGFEKDVVPSPVILGVLEHLEVKLSLCVIGVGAELAPRFAPGTGSNRNDYTYLYTHKICIFLLCSISSFSL